MLRAKEEIKKCDALLVDMTDKPTGRMIEVGIAFSFGKKIIHYSRNIFISHHCNDGYKQI